MDGQETSPLGGSSVTESGSWGHINWVWKGESIPFHQNKKEEEEEAQTVVFVVLSDFLSEVSFGCCLLSRIPNGQIRERIHECCIVRRLRIRNLWRQSKAEVWNWAQSWILQLFLIIGLRKVTRFYGTDNIWRLWTRFLRINFKWIRFWFW